MFRVGLGCVQGSFRFGLGSAQNLFSVGLNSVSGLLRVCIGCGERVLRVGFGLRLLFVSRKAGRGLGGRAQRLPPMAFGNYKTQRGRRTDRVNLLRFCLRLV